MSMNMKQTFKVTALAAALLSVYGPAYAEGENSVSVGVGNWSNNREQQGIYDGRRDSGAYGLLDADISKRNDATGTWLGLKARNLGVDNREIKGTWERQGDIGGSIEYSRITRDNPYTYNTGVQGIGTTTQIVPNPTITPGTGTNVTLGTQRDRLTAKFFKNLGTGLNLNIAFRNEEKDGTRAWGRGGAAEFAVEPINSTIRLLETTLSYSRDRLQLSGGFYGTTYSNSNKLVITSLTGPTGANTYNLSQPLDTKSYEFFLNGGYNFTPTTRGTFKASFSRASVDDAIPTSTYAGLLWQNVANTPDARAPSRLVGDIDTTQLELGLTAKPMPRLSVVANLRYRDFADKTPIQQIIFQPPGNGNVWNTPWSYTNKTGKLEGTYRLDQGYSILGGIEYKGQDRQIPTVGTLWVPHRQTQNETTYLAQLRKAMSETVNGTLAYSYSKRDGSRYVVPGDPIEDTINPLNISDRKRDKLRAMLDWSPVEKLSLQFVFEDSKDRYSGQVGPYGLQDGTARLYAMDASFQVNSAWQIRAWVSRDETRANEITLRAPNGSTVADAVKYNNLTETGNSFGLGVVGQVSSKLKVGGDIESFRSVNEFKQNVTLLGANPVFPTTSGVTLVPLPDITNKLFKLKLFAEYAVQKNADIRVNVIREKWDTNDWSYLMFPASGATPWAYGSTADGTTVLSNPQQNSTFVGVQYRYKFQ